MKWGTTLPHRTFEHPDTENRQLVVDRGTGRRLAFLKAQIQSDWLLFISLHAAGSRCGMC